MKLVPVISGTIPHEIYAKHAGAKVMLKPAAEGTSIVAGGSIRSVAELAGITDLLAKSMGSSNKVNNVTATIKALTSFNQEIVEKIEAIVERKAGRLAAKDKKVEKAPALEPKTEKTEKAAKPTAKKVEKAKKNVEKKSNNSK
jgi:hypothetical protein